MPTPVDILKADGLWHRWRIESDKNFHHDSKDAFYLDHCRYITTPLYMCNRPPGAAGALIVNNSTVVYGWVAPPGGNTYTCKTLGCEMVDGHCIRNMHAEVQAICRAARSGVPIKGATLYSLLKPCYNCSRIIIAAGINRIVYAGAAYDEERTQRLLHAAGVVSEYVDIELGYGMEIIS